MEPGYWGQIQRSARPNVDPYQGANWKGFSGAELLRSQHLLCFPLVWGCCTLTALISALSPQPDLAAQGCCPWSTSIARLAGRCVGCGFCFAFGFALLPYQQEQRLCEY